MQINRYRSGTIRFVLSLSRELNEIVKRLCSNVFYSKTSSKSFTTVTQTSDRIIDEACSIERCLLYIGTRTEQRKRKVGRRNGKLKGASQWVDNEGRGQWNLWGWKKFFIYIYVMYFSSFVFDDPRIYLSGIVLRGAESRTANIKSIENHSNQRGNKVG